VEISGGVDVDVKEAVVKFESDQGGEPAATAVKPVVSEGGTEIGFEMVLVGSGRYWLEVVDTKRKETGGSPEKADHRDSGWNRLS